MRCEEPVKVFEILRLTEQGYSQREIVQSDPAINKSYWEFAKHYKGAILPARVRIGRK